MAERYPVVERYDGFILVEVPDDQVEALAATYPVEDVTDHYTIRAGERLIDTSQPRYDASGRLHSHPAYKGVKKVSAERIIIWFNAVTCGKNDIRRMLARHEPHH